ncbi:MAG TPA: hypothetical protein VGU73_01780 [Acidimicrobiia bacterium]|nr:hypothetical protein [Acidimicrobiia bacterium]
MTPTVLLILGAFLASAVEMVEALTIVLAVGVTRGWRAALLGVGAACLTLAVLVAALGPALTQIPISALRVFVGAVLLVFGLQWLRKAILRAGGVRALHDEEEIYAREVALSEEAGAAPAGLDWYGFTLSFKGVLLEGLEVVLIVVSFGSTGGHLGLAAAGAAGALVVVGGVGALVHRPLSRVPENSMKFVVGIMLSSFGVFWGGEGVGVKWPGSDLALLGVIAFFVLVALLLVADLRRRVTPASRVVSGA